MNQPENQSRAGGPGPPAENCRRLGTFPRAEGSELRVCQAEYQGRGYVSLRVWERDRNGQWWPIKGKGCSIRLGEIAGLIEVLGRVEDPEAPQDLRGGRDTDQARRSPDASPLPRSSPADRSTSAARPEAQPACPDVDDGRPTYVPRGERTYRTWWEHLGLPDPRPRYDDRVSGELEGF